MRLSGLVTDDPDVRDTYTNLRVSVERLQMSDRWLPVSGLIQASVPRYLEYRYGDSLDLTGQLEEPPVLEDFSYKDYLARQGVYALLRRSQVTVWGSSTPSSTGRRPSSPLPWRNPTPACSWAFCWASRPPWPPAIPSTARWGLASTCSIKLNRAVSPAGPRTSSNWTWPQIRLWPNMACASGWFLRA